jgi:hypothetical protein
MTELKKLIKLIFPDLLVLLKSEESSENPQKGLDKPVFPSIHDDEEKRDG